MQIEISDVNKYQNITKQSFLNRFIKSLQQNNLLIDYKYYTQINILSKFFHYLIEFVFGQLNLDKLIHYEIDLKEIDQEYFLIKIKFFNNHQSDNSSTNQTSQISIKILQLDQVIKIILQSSSINYPDTFSILYKQYLNPKVSNHYKINSIKEIKQQSIHSKKQTISSQLNHILISRLLTYLSYEQFMKQSQSKISLSSSAYLLLNEKMFKRSKLFIQMLSTSYNFLLICAFLDIRSIVQIKLLNLALKNVFFNQNEKKIFKKIYQFSYGQTGFNQDELDFKKLLNKKRSEKKKSKLDKLKQQQNYVFLIQ